MDLMKKEKSDNDFVKGDSAENLDLNQTTRVWCGGSFDLYHYGHANLLRKAKESGRNTELVVGLYSDKDIRGIEGEPVFTEDERYEMLKANKWVEAENIVRQAPSVFSLNVLEDHSCAYAMFGAKAPDRKTRSWIESGHLKMEEKTKSISSGSIIHRILSIEDRDENNNTESGINWDAKNYFTIASGFSSNEIIQFSSGTNTPKPGDKIVYVAGAFDILHPGHLEILKKARKLGDFLLVGVHSDETVKKYAGPKYPVMRWDERLMALLSCKYVSDVIMHAPFKIPKNLIEEFSIQIVAGADFLDFDEKDDPYAYAKSKGIFRPLEISGTPLTTEMIVERVQSKWFEYEDRLASSSSSDFMARGEIKNSGMGKEDNRLETHVI